MLPDGARQGGRGRPAQPRAQQRARRPAHEQRDRAAHYTVAPSLRPSAGCQHSLRAPARSQGRLARTPPASGRAASEQLVGQLLELKAEGNAAYQQRDYLRAIEIYSRAVQQLPDLDDASDESLHSLTPELLKQAAIILCNRSAAYMGEKKAVAALADAQMAVDYDSSNWKAHWRVGLAFMQMEPRLERSEKAIAAFEATLLCTSLPAAERDNVVKALEAARYRLREGRDELDMPDMSEGCVLS